MALMKKVVVYMPDDLLAEIDTEADRTGASRSAVIRDLTYAALRRRRADRATEIQTLLRHAGPHGGNAAERVKQMRPRDPWVPSVDLRRIRREAPADPGLYADLDVVRRAELET
jgi:Arc/MetJ-type ribon-helix-helix transcriptional regulator